MSRLTQSETLRVNPASRLTFTYKNKALTGLSGDTVATALYASGVRVFSRSIKYHRPRGLYSLDGESANSLLEIDGLANTPAETTYLVEGMQVKPQNVIGSPERDWMGVIDRFSPVMPAGFYYRLFHKPQKLWPRFQNVIRKAAGIGTLNPSRLPGRSEELFLNTEVCVLGGGPAGMCAALAAAEHGLRVALIEARPFLGGFYDWRQHRCEGISLHQRAVRIADDVNATPAIRVFKHASVAGIWGDNLVTAFQKSGPGDPFDERYIEIRAQSVVVATGASERPLIFEHNDRPGVMQASCAHRLARTYGLMPGQRAVFCVGDDQGLEAAVDLAELGMDIAAVADIRDDGHGREWVNALYDHHIPFMPGWAVQRVYGRHQACGVLLVSLGGPGRRRLDCDLVAASAGLSPNNGPLHTAGAEMSLEPHTYGFMPKKMPPGVFAAGRVMGYVDPESIEASGRLAGLEAAMATGVALAAEVKDAGAVVERATRVKGSKLVSVPGTGQGVHSFVCFDEDSTVKHIIQAARQGFDVPELAKRFTATGTGPSQGGIPGHNLPLLLAQLKEGRPPVVQPTTVRPPLTPAVLSSYAGPRHPMFKRTPLHRLQKETGALFHKVGVWKRARYFSRDSSSRVEIENVHKNVGLIDVSTLGKFRIFGPDARQALDRIYVGDMSRVKPHRLTYTAMVNDAGNLMDDGVVVKVSENDYYFTTSTGRAGQTVEWFRYHTRYEGWDYHLVNLTDAWGAVNLAGPNSREVLAGLTDADLSNHALPYMGYREILLKGLIPVRLLRVGFVGELGFEIHFPASWGEAVWEMLMEAGRSHEIKPFGLEAQNVLRLEKGHVIIGVDSEIRTTLHDLNLGFLWHRDKPEAKTVGAPALRFTEKQENRLKLVGFRMDDSFSTPGDGALIVSENAILGYVTTARYSALLKQSIGLALVEAPLANVGQKLNMYQADMGNARYTATVVNPPFHDPAGQRLRM
jgi:sarcosine oxidase, subunit alpha